MATFKAAIEIYIFCRTLVLREYLVIRASLKSTGYLGHVSLIYKIKNSTRNMLNQDIPGVLIWYNLRII